MNGNFLNSDLIYKIEEEDLIVRENENTTNNELNSICVFDSEYLDFKVDFVIIKSDDILEKEITERIKASNFYLPALLGVCNYSSLGNGLVLEKVKGKSLHTLIYNNEINFEERIEIIYSLISMFDFSNSRNLYFKNLILKDLVYDKKSDRIFLNKCPINNNENYYSNEQLTNLPPEYPKMNEGSTKSETCEPYNDISVNVNENSNSWILGLLIAEILEGKHILFNGKESKREILKILSILDNNSIFKKINSLSYNQYLKNVMKKLLKVDPKQRSNSKLIKQKFNKNLILSFSKNLKSKVKEDFNDTAFLIKNEASLMDLSRDLNFNVTINNDTVCNKRKFSEEINFETECNIVVKSVFNNEVIIQENIIKEDIFINENIDQTEVTAISLKINKEENLDVQDKVVEKFGDIFNFTPKDNKNDELYGLKEIFEKKEDNINYEAGNKTEILDEETRNVPESQFIDVNETNNENLIEEIQIKLGDKENHENKSIRDSSRDIIELNKIFTKPVKTITDRLEELANDYQITSSERYLEEIEDILNCSSENLRTEINLDSISKNLWDTLMIIAFKHLENDDLKSHYALSSILYTSVDKIYSDNILNIALAKFHYAKCMKDYSCNYSLSLNLFLESINLLEKVNEADSKIGIQVKFFLGNLYTDMGMSDESIAILRDVLNKQINLFTEQHSFTARTYNCLGIAEDNRCNYRQAREYYQKSYTIFKLLSYGLETIDSAKVLNNLAGIYFKWDDFTSSIKFYLKVLEVYLNKYGENCSYVGVTYYNLGNCYLMINNDDKAMEYLKKSKEIFTKELGASHPQTAMSCKNLGDLYYTLNEDKNALELYSQCINTFLEKFGEDHDLYVTTLAKIKKLKT